MARQSRISKSTRPATCPTLRKKLFSVRSGGLLPGDRRQHQRRRLHRPDSAEAVQRKHEGNNLLRRFQRFHNPWPATACNPQLNGTSYEFEIQEDLYHNLLDQTVKMLSLQRCGQTLTADWAGAFAMNNATPRSLRSTALISSWMSAAAGMTPAITAAMCRPGQKRSSI